MSQAEPRLADLRRSPPLQAKISGLPGVHYLPMDTDGTVHGSILIERKRAFLDGLPRNSRPLAKGPTA